jgi:Ala-tRNA(Pro) deacylase
MDSTPPFDDTALFARLDALGIRHQTVDHPPLYTVEQSRALRGDLPGAHIKNLFLRDKKRRMWLVTVLESRDMDLKALRPRIGAQGNLSFGNPDLLMAHLGVIPGAVTPFAVINDRAGDVSMVLDKALLTGGVVNAHPLRNDRTTAIGPDDLMKFLDAEGHAPLILDFDEEEHD